MNTDLKRRLSFARLAGAIVSIVAAVAAFPAVNAETGSQEILNVSYDVSREFYKDYNAAFIKHWQEKTGRQAVVKQSHGGSSAQARAVLGGLEADVVTMNQESDINILSEAGKLVREDWRLRFPHRSVPSTSTIVFLVRKGNPRHIRDWDDLAKPGIAVVMPNPKTSGNGRYSFLAAWGQVLKRGGTEQEAKDFIRRFVQNVPVFDTGGRGATTTFVQREIGDVLLTFENEISLIQKELGADRFDVVYPSISILTETPVAVVDAVVDKHGTRKIAEAYLEYLYSDEGQEIAAKHHYRPCLARIADKYAARFPSSSLWSVDDLLGGWKNAIKTHFTDGGTFDQIYDEIPRQRK